MNRVPKREKDMQVQVKSEKCLKRFIENKKQQRLEVFTVTKSKENIQKGKTN